MKVAQRKPPWMMEHRNITSDGNHVLKAHALVKVREFLPPAYPGK